MFVACLFGLVVCGSSLAACFGVWLLLLWLAVGLVVSVCVYIVVLFSSGCCLYLRTVY